MAGGARCAVWRLTVRTKPIGYLTNESLGRLRHDKARSGTVPLHAHRSPISRIAVYHEDDVARYAHMAAHFARGLHLAGVRPAEQSAMIAALWYGDAEKWWGVERPDADSTEVIL